MSQPDLPLPVGYHCEYRGDRGWALCQGSRTVAQGLSEYEANVFSFAFAAYEWIARLARSHGPMNLPSQTLLRRFGLPWESEQSGLTPELQNLPD